MDEEFRTVYGWSSKLISCERCGEATTRRWRDGEGMVCPSCKEW